MKLRRSVAAAVATCFIGAGLVSIAPVATAASPIDPERYSQSVTGWYWYTTATEATIKDRMSSGNYRLIDVEVVSTNPLKFAVSMVRNSGTYKRTSSWFIDESASSLKNKLSGKRIIDLETYFVGEVKKYTAIAVDNSGDKYKQYQWWLNQTQSSIGSKVEAYGGRIVDIDRQPNGSYNFVMIKNTGSDNKPWLYYFSKTVDQIKELTAGNDARLVDIEPEGGGLFTVVMVGGSNPFWWWHDNISSSGLTDLYRQTGTRIIDLERYVVNGNTRYAALMVNNLDSTDAKVRTAMRSATQPGMAFGFYLKKVDGATESALQHKKVFEPASMIKVLHLLAAMRKVKDPDLDWDVTDNVTWYAHPDFPARYVDDSGYVVQGGTSHKDVCAYNQDGTTPEGRVTYSDDLGPVVLKQMMEQSDNRNTDAVWNTFGKTWINATADWVGMTQSHLNHRIGCTWAAQGATDKRNELTLYDAGLLYEKVWRKYSPILGVGTLRNQFADYMGTGLGSITPVVEEEAPNTTVANDFIEAMRGAFKAGGYTNWTSDICGSISCASGLFRNTGGGYVGIPFKGSNGLIERRGYVYGAFFDGELDCGPGDSLDCSQESGALGTARVEAYQEMLRPIIKQALATWD